MRRCFHLMVTVVFVFMGVTISAAYAQEKAAPPAKKIAVRAGHLIDGRNDRVVDNALILIEGDTITSVSSGGQPPAGVEVLDLSQYTVMPGFTDTHTHVILNGDITAEDYDVQLLKQSIPYRAILGARNARIALEHGFTTLRDLETEGAMYADVDVKTAIANGEVPGPRMQVATRAMTPTGMYPLLGYSWELKVPTGVQYVDGVDGARKAVREQVMYGADWIKYYSDRKYHFEADGVLHSMVNFTDEEAKAIVDESHRLGKRVAAHAIGSDGIAAALRAGGYGRRELVVRVNGLATPWGYDDMAAAAAMKADAVLLPKVESAHAVRQAASVLAAHDAPEILAIWCMMETPRGVLHAEEIAGASPRVGVTVMSVFANDTSSASRSNSASNLVPTSIE